MWIKHEFTRAPKSGLGCTQILLLQSLIHLHAFRDYISQSTSSGAIQNALPRISQLCLEGNTSSTLILRTDKKAMVDIVNNSYRSLSIDAHEILSKLLSILQYVTLLNL